MKEQIGSPKNVAVIYVRVSTKDQVENASLDTQERVCRKHCESAGLRVERIFREEGVSAKTLKRPQIVELLDFCRREGKRLGITTVVIYAFDRISRNIDDSRAIAITLKRLGIRVESTTQPTEDTASGQLSRNLAAVLAQFDNDFRSERTKDVMQNRLRNGQWLWRAPIGYRNGERGGSKSLVPDEDSGPLVIRAFQKVAYGMHTNREVLAELTSLGLRTADGGRLSIQAFGEMLKNPLYMGDVVSKTWGIRAKGDFEPLVDQTLFGRVQKVGIKPSVVQSGRRWDHPDFPLRRVMRCGKCGSPMTGSWSKGRNAKYSYYRCPRGGCKNTSIRTARLDEMFVELLRGQTVSPENFDLLEAVIEDVVRAKNADSIQTKSRLNAKLNDLENKEARLLDLLLARSISKDAYYRGYARFKADREDSQASLESLTRDEIDVTKILAFARWLLGDLESYWNRLSWQFRPQFARAVFPGGFVFKDMAIGTTHSPLSMACFGTPKSEESDWAPPTGFEPVLPP